MSARNQQFAAGAAALFRAPERPSKWRTLLAACVGLGMLMIDTFVVNVAFPAIGRDLKADLSTAGWTVSAYVLMVGVLPIAMGRLGDIYGRRRVYLVGLLIFILASVACGFAATIGQLILFRILQGVGAATMMPGTLAIITQAFPPHQRGLAIGIWGGVSGIGLIAGPILGGLLVHGDSWRAIFLVNAPIGVLALLMALRFVPESRDETAPRVVDWLGLALLTSALLLIMVGLTRANDDGWRSPPILAAFVVGAALLPLFVVVESRVRAPLIDLALFRNTTFVMACLSAALFSAAVFGSQPYVSLFMQNYWGFSPLQGGLAFLPATILVAAIMPVSGIMGQRLGHRLRLIVIGGSLAVGLSAVYLLQMDTNSTYAEALLPPFLIRGLGIGLVMSAGSLAVMSAAPGPKAGLASGTLTMSRQIGTAIGVALLGAVFTHQIDATLPERLAAVAPAEAARVTAAAHQFVPAGDAVLRPVAEQVIIDGFVRIALVTVGFCAVATVAAVFIRHRPVAKPVSPAAAVAAGPRPLAAGGDPAGD